MSSFEHIRDTVVPHLTGLLENTQRVMKSELRLAEARVFAKIDLVQERAVRAGMGIGAGVIAVTLLVWSVYFALVDLGLPRWGATGVLAVVSGGMAWALFSSKPWKTNGVRNEESRGE